jgi:uncharacterized protein YycO
MIEYIFKRIFLVSGMITSLSLLSCQSEFDRSDLRNGDILFTGSNIEATEGLSNAIDDVTQTDLETNYTHMGIVEKENKKLWVIHASPEKGVCREPLDIFLETRKVATAYRLDKSFQSLVPEAMEKAHKLVGLPYDPTYIIGGDAHYCSGLLYTIYEDHQVFDLEPMTFKIPSTGDFHPIWIKHYEALGMEIPEGLPGCNPNGLAASANLQLMGQVTY